MSTYYGNITLRGPGADEVIAWLKANGDVAYVSPVVNHAAGGFP